MTSRDFAYWLQGFFEITQSGGAPATLTPAQVQIVQRQVSLVFKHEIDPSMGGQAHQATLSNLHGPSSSMLLRC